MDELKKCAALILAAGFSERMGYMKPFLKTNTGITFLEYLVEGFYALEIENVVIIVNSEGVSMLKSGFHDLRKKATVIVNKKPGNGRFGSIRLGLNLLGNSQPVFLQNCDAPFLSGTILQTLLQGLHGYDLAIPAYKSKGGHPVLISPDTAPKLLDFPQEDTNFKDLLKQFQQHRIEVNDERILLNINTPEEYKAYFERHLKRS